MLNAGVGAGPIAEEPCRRLLLAPQDTAQAGTGMPDG